MNRAFAPIPDAVIYPATSSELRLRRRVSDLETENAQLRRANTTIHDTLTAEVKRLKRLVGEAVFDPPQWREAEPPAGNGASDHG